MLIAQSDLLVLPVQLWASRGSKDRIQITYEYRMHTVDYHILKQNLEAPEGTHFSRIIRFELYILTYFSYVFLFPTKA